MGITCKDDTDFFSNRRGLALPRIRVFGFKVAEQLGSGHYRLLNGEARLQGDRTQDECARGLHRDLLVSAIVLPFFKPRFVVRSAG